MSKFVTGWEVGRELSQALGIEHMTDVVLHFPMGDPVSATVTFLLSEVQAKAVLALCSDGKWRTPKDE